MKDLLTVLKELYESDISLVEIPIVTSYQVGTEISLKLDTGEIIASGCETTRDIALRICIAEALERGLAMKLSCEKASRDSFNISNFPTTCGFAAGFESDKTKLRAIAEGLERWAWSQWIDNKCGLDSVSINETTLNPLTRFFLSNFSDSRCYEKHLSLSLDGVIFSFKLLIFLGLTKDGIFPGSRVLIVGDESAPWNHAILEAYRCLKNFNLSKNENGYPEDIIAKRAIYFGQNKNLALSQIEAAQIKNIPWSQPKISLLKEYRYSDVQVYLWRCLIRDYVGWHLGTEKRFVY